MLSKLEEINLVKEANNYLANNNNGLTNDQKRQIIETNLDNYIETSQIDWTTSKIYEVLNNGFDAGIRLLLPDYIENEVIDLKNNILNSGVQNVLRNTVIDVLKVGKEKGAFSKNKFESVNEVKETLESGNLIDGISDLLDKEIDSVKENKIITEKVADRLKDEKNTIIEQVENNFDVSFENQIKNFGKMEKYIENWKNAYNSKDFSKMQREYNKMAKIMNELMPLENTINEFRTLENLQTLIKNNGKNFDLTPEALELANKLIN